MINPVEVTRMMEVDFNEKRPSETTLSQDDRTFLKRVGEGIHLSNGHYEMPLAFRQSEPTLPNNKALALHRLKQLRARFKKD